MGHGHILDSHALFCSESGANILKGYPFTYQAAFWGMVFPMGMYTACTATFAHALKFPALMVVPHWFIWVALIGWTATFVGMLGSRWHILRYGPPDHLF